jgi:hypothetical protein
MRVQIELSDDLVAQIDRMQKVCKVKTQGELFNNALALFGWAVNHRENGRQIASVDHRNGKLSELSLGALDLIETAQGGAEESKAPAARPERPPHAVSMAAYEVAKRFGVYEARAFDLADEMWLAMRGALLNERDRQWVTLDELAQACAESEISDSKFESLTLSLSAMRSTGEKG